jgi:hypothetical protein
MPESTTQGGPNIVTDKLVLHLDAANPQSYPGSGTTWTELTINQNNGTLTNNPTFNSTNCGSIVFNGTNTTVELGNPASLSITTSLTLTSWIYVTSTATYGSIISKWGFAASSAKVYKSAVFQTTNYYYLDISNNGVNDIYRLSAQPLQTNTWYNTVGVYTSEPTPTIDIYINGQLSNGTLVGTVPSTLNTVSTANVSLGTDNAAGGGNFFTGRIATAQVYNKALSATEIQSNYNALKGRFGL